MESNVDLSQYRLSPEQLRWICPPDAFSFECTDELEELEGFLGQERALSSIEFGLRMEKSGYNLFVVGPTGTGRASAVKNRIERLVKEKKEKGITPEINDWCYIFNFDDPDRPQVLKLPRGEGKVLSRLVDELLKNLRDAIPKTFAGDEYKNQKQILIDEQQRKNRQIIQELEKEALEEGFAFRMTPMGPILIPLVEGKPMTQEQYLALGEEEKEIIESKRRELLTQISEAFDKIHQLEVELKNKIAELDRRVAEFAVNPLFKGPLDRYASSPEVLKFLELLQNFTLSYLHIFRDLSETPQQLPQLLPYQRLQDPFLPFKINVFVDNAPLEDPPIILETHPNWSNLFGKIERRAFMGAYFSDHTMLKSGSLHQANGGYIIMYFRDLISNPGVWEGLKRTLKNQEIRLEDPFEQFGIIAPQGLRPDPLPFDAKVIIIGDEYYYRALTLLDEDFRDLFKIKADLTIRFREKKRFCTPLPVLSIIVAKRKGFCLLTGRE